MNLATDVPRIILGTMNFGEQVDEIVADHMLAMFLDRGYKEIDTAYKYNDGASEEMLGRLLTPERRGKVYLATKASPLSGGGLGPENIVKQVNTSLRRLKTDYIDLLYLHAPDPKIRIEVTLEACEKLFKDGKFRELGLSNYASWQVADIWHICRRNGWMIPSVYQGRYNAITRDVESELFPAVRNFGIRFYAYNPLAGGLLTGRYSQIGNVPREGRFALKSAYLDRFWKKSYFDAIEVVQNASEQAGLSMIQMALRWLLRYSFLKGPIGDGVILAASNLKQWECNLNSLSGELPMKVVEALDRAWGITRQDCPSYSRA
ncbi:MAG: aldehyde oxidoreductase [Syntrophobacterales bacterium CG03_land_8_20_14_0_80_58_14]|nr:MAG: aldehyde oxidoreductase [Syntrophobacterales bacterium CG03_land_8_20_14_0_80_58_14]